MPKQPDDLSRKGEPSQKTAKGLEIPVPQRREFFGGLKRAAKKNPPKGPSPPDPEKR